MRGMFVGLVLVSIAAIFAGCDREDAAKIPYSPDFVQLVEGGKVAQVRIVEKRSGITYITGQTKPGVPPGKFRVDVANLDDSLDLLIKNQVAVDFPPRSPGAWQWLSVALPPLILLIGVAVVIFVLTLAVRLVRAVERIARNTEK